jgi:hypothetical protein
MTTPVSGQISLSNVRAEIGVGGPIGLLDASVRILTGLSSGPVSLNDCHGKTGAGGGGTGFAATGTGDLQSGTATGTAFTAHAYPTASSTGGSGTGKTYLWSIATQDDTGFAITNGNTATPTVTHLIGNYGYFGACTLNCVCGDDIGNTKTVTGLTVRFDFESTV